jgi:hypothetical protein
MYCTFMPHGKIRGEEEEGKVLMAIGSRAVRSSDIVVA